MTGLVQLLLDVAAVMRTCPEIVAEVGEKADAIVPYLDLATSDTNSLTRFLYSMPNGAVVIAWQSTTIEEGDMMGFAHHLDFYVRARRRQSPLSLINAVIDGVPTGDTVRWRYLCVNADVLPMQVEEIARLIDEEGIDYHVIRALFREKGDDTYGVSS